MKLQAVKWNGKTQVALEDYPGYILMMDGTIICSLNQKTVIKKPHISNRGYARICMKHKSGKYLVESVHVLVAKYFTNEPKDENAYIIHIDGNKEHNIIRNLAFGTKSDMYKYYKELGLYKKDVPKYGVPIAVKCLENGTHYVSMTAAANDLGLSRPEIGRQVRGDIKHVKGYHFERVYKI